MLGSTLRSDPLHAVLRAVSCKHIQEEVFETYASSILQHYHRTLIELRHLVVR
jgi:hypothetical protein